MQKSHEEFITPRLPKTGTNRKNSLYYFIQDNVQADVLSGYAVSPSYSTTRHALFIAVPLEDSHTSPFFEFEPLSSHLSVDEHYVAESSSQARPCICAVHITLIYRHQVNGSRGIRVHVRFNQNGQLTREPVSVVECELDRHGHVIRTGLNLSFDPKQLDLILAQASAARELVNQLYQEKANRYLELENQAAELSHVLAQQYAQCHDYAPLADILNQLKAITERLTAYSDVLIDGRTAFLSGLLDAYQPGNSAVVRHSDSPTAISAVDDQLSALSMQAVASPKKANEQQLKRDIQALVQRIQAIEQASGAVADRLLAREPLYQEFNVLTLSLSIKQRNFIKQQAQTIHLPALKEYFYHAALAGDLAAIEKLYPVVVQQDNLNDLFGQLVTAIINERDPSSSSLKGRIAVADFFYEQSQSYRSFLTLQSDVLTYINRYQAAVGKLLVVFTHNNLLGFEMLLRQGFAVDSVQYCWGDKAFNVMQTIILFYSQPSHLEYIRLLLEFGASMQVMPLRLEVLSALKKKSHLPLVQLSTLPKEQSDQGWDKLHAIRHIFPFTFTHHQFSHPELISLFSHHTEVDALFTPLFLLLTSSLFLRREIMGSLLGQSVQIFSDKVVCDTFVLANQASRAEKAWMPVLFFYVKSGPLSPSERASVALANQLLQLIIERFTVLELAVQRRIRDQLRRDALVSDKFFAIAGYLGAQCANNLLTQPEQSDFEFILQLYVLIGKIDCIYAKSTTLAAQFFMTNQPKLLQQVLNSSKAGQAVAKKTSLQNNFFPPSNQINDAAPSPAVAPNCSLNTR